MGRLYTKKRQAEACRFYIGGDHLRFLLIRPMPIREEMLRTT